MESPLFDVLVVGGSFSGLSAALTLARSGRRLLIVDDDAPCNKTSEKAYNLLTNDGLSPHEIKAKAIADVRKYPSAHFSPGTVAEIAVGSPFLVKTTGGQAYRSQTVLLCTGMADIIPDIPGFAACWGKSIIHCPYCHAYEQQASHVAMFGNSDDDVALAGLLKTWNKGVTLLTNGRPLSTDQQQLLDKQQLSVITAPVSGLRHHDGRLLAVLFDGHEPFNVRDLFVNPLAKQHSPLAEQSGCELIENGLIRVDDFHRTTVPGIYAAGDCCTAFRTISTAIASGTQAGIFIHQDLHKNYLKALMEDG
ncbi:NAD(P)/FAD-dependent oxidoreductase [Parapedobacter sp. ISTM3]|uniref:NAD(P)/FAD-dependent oxidoreductase n=1 Tax=Parapedobacter sp. ISTM3 TaxID=2800130 RepID=UPI001903D722|nr:NAD(P)/FAD-dependent oxidoreductase [Parapedobacter sp. ISTM3]MBK1440498.1 NAD(P)/FAD-dependent oxidoreductase [Parapedobacter sp. ISTM3]